MKFERKKIKAAIQAMKPGAQIMLEQSEHPDFVVFKSRLTKAMASFCAGDQAVILVCLVHECGMSPDVANNIATKNPITLKTFLAINTIYLGR